MVRLRRAVRLAVLGATAALLALAAPGCSLGNVAQDDCSGDGECTELFGLGSRCDAGYCTDAKSCASVVDCRAAFGAGAACSSGRCAVAPKEPRCTLSEPEDLAGAFPGLVADRIVLGAVFKTGTEKEAARADAARLAIREINETAGGIEGTPLGLVVCDNDSDGKSDNDKQETDELVRYLTASLGAPVVIGPSSSANSLAALGDVLMKERLAAALLSPSATSIALTDAPDRFDPDGQPYGLFWRTCPSDALQGKVLAKLVTDDAMTQKVAIVYQNDTYGLSFQKVLQDELAARGLPEVGLHVYDIDPPEALAGAIQVAVDGAVDESPDAVVVVSSDAGRTVQVLEAAAATTLADTAAFFLTDGSKDAAKLFGSTNAAFNAKILPALRGTAPASPSGPLYNTFSTALKSQFDRDASQYSFVAHSYDAAYVAVYGVVWASAKGAAFDGFDLAAGFARLSSGAAVEVGPTDFPAAVTALGTGAATVDVKGTSGALNFDAKTGEAPGPIEVWSADTATKVLATDSVVDPETL